MKAMTINEVREMCGEIAEKANVKIICPIKENGRLKTTLGRVKYENAVPIIIEFSKTYLENGSNEAITDTIRHEMAHYIATMRTGERHGHDAYWKSVCEEIGAEPERLKKGKIYVVEAQKVYKYSLYCENCGKNIANYHRKGKIIENIENCYSKCCHSSIEVIQNF